ncbi:MAG TPA: YegS/Rv2252/BmrU family lipid kinase [Verrucomicrobiae bacterium]|nr:YegS/Rv2252/BmrU family lipid kinase [Verrucomicrobiae bacterium]
MTPTKAALVINTASRRGRRLKQTAEKLLREAGLDIESHPVSNPANLQSQVGGLIEKGFRLIIVGGGDGTISEIVDQLVYKDVVLGILPLGTANSFVRSLDIPNHLPTAVAAIANGKVAEIDLGKINDTYFANAVSLGFSSRVAANLPDNLKRYLGIFSYLVQGIRAMAHLRPFEVWFPGNNPVPFQTYQLVIANGGYYGPASLIHKSRLESADITIFTFKGLSPLQLLAIWMRALLGRRLSKQNLDRVVVEKELILETNPPQSVSLDGEVTTTTPIRISVAPKALKVIVAETSKL